MTVKVTFDNGETYSARELRQIGERNARPVVLWEVVAPDGAVVAQIKSEADVMGVTWYDGAASLWRAVRTIVRYHVGATVNVVKVD